MCIACTTLGTATGDNLLFDRLTKTVMQEADENDRQRQNAFSSTYLIRIVEEKAARAGPKDEKEITVDP